MDINWLDGKNANGMFILEIHFNNGTKGYLKNESKEWIANYCVLISDMPEINGFLVHNPEERLQAA